ncbi:MAG: hypothetical protein GX410_02435 [Elusimicrobia bacterium]|nr:hypothetical protein [Elusimicrobiota bacterium]
MAGFYGGAAQGAIAAAAGKIASAFGYTTEYILAHTPQWLEWALEQAAAREERTARLLCAALGTPPPQFGAGTDENPAALAAMGLGPGRERQ